MTDQAHLNERTRLIANLLNDMFDRNVGIANRVIGDFVAEKTLYRIMRDKKYRASEYTLNTIELATGMRLYDSTIYRNLASKIGQRRFELAEIAESYVGTYNYYRYRNDLENRLEYISGSIKIYIKDGVIMFDHSRGEAPDVRHTGYVFLCDDRLYMLGFGNNTMRLGIAEGSRNVSAELMHGVVVSATSSEKSQYGSHFIMVNQESKSITTRLSDPASGEAYFRSLIPEGVFYIGRKRRL